MNVSGCDGGDGGTDDDKMGDGDPFKATRTYLKINQKLEWLRVNDVDKTANDQTVFWIKLKRSVRRSFFIQDSFSLLPPKRPYSMLRQFYILKKKTPS